MICVLNWFHMTLFTHFVRNRRTILMRGWQVRSKFAIITTLALRKKSPDEKENLLIRQIDDSIMDTERQKNTFQQTSMGDSSGQLRLRYYQHLQKARKPPSQLILDNLLQDNNDNDDGGSFSINNSVTSPKANPNLLTPPTLLIAQPPLVVLHKKSIT